MRLGTSAFQEAWLPDLRKQTLTAVSMRGRMAGRRSAKRAHPRRTSLKAARLRHDGAAQAASTFYQSRGFAAPSPIARKLSDRKIAGAPSRSLQC